jgi:hypothetical protein
VSLKCNKPVEFAGTAISSATSVKSGWKGLAAFGLWNNAGGAGVPRKVAVTGVRLGIVAKWEMSSREAEVLYLVESRPTIEQGNKVDAGEGPGPIVAKIVERFRPQAVYGNPSRRQIMMVVNLNTAAEMAELMYALTWFTCSEPTFTPVMGPEIYAEAIANAKRILSPPT